MSTLLVGSLCSAAPLSAQEVGAPATSEPNIDPANVAAAAPAAAPVSTATPAPPVAPPPEPHFAHPFLSDSASGKWRAVGLGTLGIATAFLAHEAGHVLMNLAYGNVPEFSGLRYAGFIPFFRISHGLTCNASGECIDINGDPFLGGPSGVYMITAAGFNVQHLLSEVVLRLDPELRYHRSPFAKGVLFFNLALSAGYVLSTWAQIKPPMGDILGMATATGLNANWVALMVAIPMGIDLYRFFVPDSRWAPYAGIGAKVLFLGVSFVF